jgi:hypothetical protein
MHVTWAFIITKDINANKVSLGHVQLGHFLSSFATFLSGILIAAICCWEVALLTLLVFPLILAIGATYTKKMNTITAGKMLFQSEATCMVEQVRVSKAKLIANHLHREPVPDLII